MRRLAAAVAVVMLVVAGTVLLATRGGASGPAEGAAALVPGRALVFLHADTDPNRAATRDAVKVLERFPALRTLRDRLFASLNRYGRGTQVDFVRDIRPWLGSEAALALLDTTATSAQSVIVLDVRDPRGAREFLQRLGTPTGTARYRDAVITLFGSQSYAFVGHFLLLGPLDAVRAGIDAHADPGSSLARDAAYARATKDAPSDRVADAYVSVGGLRRLVVPGRGVLGTVGTLLDQPGLQGVAASLAAGGDHARIRVHWALAAGSPGVPAGLPLRPFRTDLLGQAPAPVSALLDANGLDRLIPKLATRLSPRYAALVTGLAPLLADQAVVAAAPGAGRPDLLVVARTRDESRTRLALANLQVPLTSLLAPTGITGGQAPTFTQRPLAGYTAFQLRLGPGLELDYAVGKGQVALATSFDLLASLAGRGRRVASDSGVRQVLPARAGPSTSLVFLALNQLLDLGEQTGLGQDPRYRAVREDLRRIRSLGLRTQSGEAESTAEINLLIP